MPLLSTRIGALDVSRLGLGCMVLTRAFGRPDRTEAVATIDLALELGVRLFDTADSYGAGENEEFVGQAIGKLRDEVVLTSKFGLVVGAGGEVGIDGRPEHVKASCEESLRRLRTDRLDLYYQHRVDPEVPIADTVGAMADLASDGKILNLGLCEVSAAELEAACAVHPIAAIQSEWSLWARQIEAEVLPAARRLGVAIVPYSPLGRGFLAGAVRSEGDIGADDLRAPDPRLSGDNLRANLDLVAALEAFANDREATPAQVALAWLLAQGDDVVPIPGCERRDLLRQNLGALRVELTPADLGHLASTFPLGAASGNPDATLMRRPSTSEGGESR